MNRVDLGRLGIPGVAGMALLLFCVSFGLTTILPAQQNLERMRKSQTQLIATAARLAPPPGQRPATERVLLPKLTFAAKTLEQFTATGQKFNVPVEQASYRFVRDEGVARYEVSLAVKTSYRALRDFLDEALTLSAASTLDDLTLRRAGAVDPVVDANIRLSFYFDGS